MYIVDDKPRPHLTADQEAFLGTIAQTVMNHMEMSREAEERKKIMRLSHGMNAFVEGKTRLFVDDLMLSTGLIPKPRAGSDGKTDMRNRSLPGRSSKDPVSLVAQRSIGKGARYSKCAQNSLPLTIDSNGSPSDPDTSQDDSDAGKNVKNADKSHQMTFARAANILCESLDVRGRGGVVFFDATSRLRQINTAVDSTERKFQRPAEVVSFSTSEEPLGSGQQAEGVVSFSPVDESLLHSLLARYPRGKMWSYDQDGCLSSSEEEILPPRGRSESESRRQSRATRKNLEAELLQKHFPGVRQIMLGGLWDAGQVSSFPGYHFMSC